MFLIISTFFLTALQKHVTNAQLDGINRIKKSNIVFPVFLVNSMMLTGQWRANFAPQTPFQAIQSGPCPVTNAHSALPHWPIPVEIRCALGAILVFTATTHNLVNALPANSVASKTSRAKPRVLIAQLAKLQMKCALIVKTHLGALVNLAKNTCMTWDLETNGHAKRALPVQSATPTPAGPPCKS
jgi:hypothetical protein